MKRSWLPVVAIAALTLPVSACDEGSSDLRVAEPFDVAEINFREGPSDPEAMYIIKWAGSVIHRAEFSKAVQACAGQKDPPLTCTLSWYQPDSTKPERVLGLGCSMFADYSLFACYRDAWLENDATPL